MMPETLLAFYAGLSLLSAIFLVNLCCLSRGGKFAQTFASVQSEAFGRNCPTVAVQLPMRNERGVAQRILESVAAIRYPSGRLEIQVLDDGSTDGTSDVVKNTLEELKARCPGRSFSYLYRPGDGGGKSGILKEGLSRTEADILAIFDADFVPEPDFLEKTIPLFVNRPRLGFVQTRVHRYLNESDSWLTRAFAHLMQVVAVTQHARNKMQLWFNFNGSAVLLRREAVVRVGGWSAVPVGEDIELSYRIQMAGYEGRYLFQYGSACEVPRGLPEFLAQQRRWYFSGVQNGIQFFLGILRAPISLWAKAQAFFYFFGAVLFYSTHTGVVLLSYPVFVLIGWESGPALAAALFLCGFYLVMGAISYAVQRGSGDRFAPLSALGALLVVSGSCFNVLVGVFPALFGKQMRFYRTPKFGANREDGEDPSERVLWVGELFLLSAYGYFLFKLSSSGEISFQRVVFGSSYLLGVLSYGLVLWQRISERGA